MKIIGYFMVALPFLILVALSVLGGTFLGLVVAAGFGVFVFASIAGGAYFIEKGKK